MAGGRANAGGRTYESSYDEAIKELRELQRQLSEQGLPPELEELRTIYSPEGSYLKEGETRIKQAQAQGTAAANVGAISTGMGSYGVAGGAAARYAREAELALQEVESQRYDKYATALSYISTTRMNQMQQQIQLAQNLANVYSEKAATGAQVYTTERGQNIQQQLGSQANAVQMAGIQAQAQSAAASRQQQQTQFEQEMSQRQSEFNQTMEYNYSRFNTNQSDNSDLLRTYINAGA